MAPKKRRKGLVPSAEWQMQHAEKAETSSSSVMNKLLRVRVMSHITAKALHAIVKNL